MKPTRKSRRLRGYDYSQNGAYHIILCTKDRAPVLGRIVGQADLCLPQIQLTDIGQLVKKYIETIPAIYKTITVDRYILMPDHIHLLLQISNNGAQESARPTVSHVVRALKIMVRKETRFSFFQESFYDHIIRDDADYTETLQYIDNNPLKWALEHSVF